MAISINNKPYRWVSKIQKILEENLSRRLLIIIKDVGKELNKKRVYLRDRKLGEPSWTFSVLERSDG